MSTIVPNNYIGNHLKDCYSELLMIGGLGTWAPYCLDNANLNHIEVRFNNHWSGLVGSDEVEYMVCVTDEKGIINSIEVLALTSLQSQTVTLSRQCNHPVLGAVYFGCISPEVTKRGSEQYRSNDYFYVAYESAHSYSAVHSQPLDVVSQHNTSGKQNCIEIRDFESSRLLLGNPSIRQSSGYIGLRNAKGGRLRKIQLELEPFSVVTLDLNVVPDGWYTIHCKVGGDYADLMRSSDKGLMVRHM